MKNGIKLFVAIILIWAPIYFTFFADLGSEELINLPPLDEQDMNCSVEGVIFIDFYADWCGPCNLVSSTVDELKEEFKGEVKIIKIDVDKSWMDTKFNIGPIPAFIVFVDGKPVDYKTGWKSKYSLRRMIKRAQKINN